MKKITLITTVLCIALFGCQKDSFVNHTDFSKSLAKRSLSKAGVSYETIKNYLATMVDSVNRAIEGRTIDSVEFKDAINSYVGRNPFPYTVYTSSISTGEQAIMDSIVSIMNINGENNVLISELQELESIALDIEDSAQCARALVNIFQNRAMIALSCTYSFVVNDTTVPLFSPTWDGCMNRRLGEIANNPVDLIGFTVGLPASLFWQYAACAWEAYF